MTRNFSTLLLILAALPALAQVSYEDGANCPAPTLVTPLASCKPVRCDVKDFDSASFIADARETIKSVEGKLESHTYVCTANLSPLQIVRNVEGALKPKGFTATYAGENTAERPVALVPERSVFLRNGGNWVGVVAGSNTDIEGARAAYEVFSIRQEEMKQEMQGLGEWTAAIEQTGRVRIYGINFDSAKATLKPDSEPVLNQVLALLNANPAWRMRIEGHTDSTGSPAANRTLADQRAQSVAAWLSGKGVARARLTTAGIGDQEPLASNDTEEGRGKNRRVELMRVDR